MRRIDAIIIHHTATPASTTVESIRRAHIARGWDTIGYHYLISADGTVHVGRPWEQVGAHCRGHNAHSLGVALVGDFTRGAPTAEALRALRNLLTILRGEWPAAAILGHRELAETECPGTLLAWVVAYRSSVQ